MRRLFKKQDNIAFSDKTPSLFVITSPLQAICAIEAIKRFNIEQYTIVLRLIDDVRNAQLFSLLDQYGLEYITVRNTKEGRLKRLLKVLIPRLSGYSRVFIGDPRILDQYMYAYLYSRNGSTVVFLDDGNDNIFLLKGHKYIQSNMKKRLLQYYFCNIVPVIRNIHVGHYLFTIYADIKNTNYKCESNNFSFFSKKLSLDAQSKGVYFVGTNHSRYCTSDNYPLELVKNGLEDILTKIKIDYPNDSIYYISHGRDTALFPKEICDKLGVTYSVPKTTIELLFLDMGCMPKAVYGFTSTALYNLKLLFPSAMVYNCTFDVNHHSLMIDQNIIVSEYYKEHGIPEIKL